MRSVMIERFFRALLGGVLLASACSKTVQPDGAGGETNWRHCEKQSDCDDGFLCKQKRCVPDVTMPHDAGTTHDGSAQSGQCETAADCTLVSKGCCGACVPTTDDFVAVTLGESDEEALRQCPEGQVSCGPCPPDTYDPLRAIPRVECKAHECVVFDERLSDAAACKQDEDCNLIGRGCCGGCGPDPRSWIALSVAADPYADQSGRCATCGGCFDSLQPDAFCAADGHCAVRDSPRVNGVESSTCFSPTQNLDQAASSGAIGCDCYDVGVHLCLVDSAARSLALECTAYRGPWLAPPLFAGCTPMK